MSFKSIIDHYYAIYVFMGVMSFISFGEKWASIVVLLIIMTTVWSYFKRPYKLNALDGVMILFILYQFFSYAFSNYPMRLWYMGIKNQIIPMLFYFIGRNLMFADNKMLVNMKTPMMVAMVFGLILYFWAPDWYIAKRTEIFLTAESSTNLYYEVTRLASFWPWSYTMGYASLIFIMYYCRDFFRKDVGIYNQICLLVAVLVLFFAQQRTTMAFFVVFLALFTFFSPKEQRKKLLYVWFIIILIMIGITYYMMNYADSDFVEYVLGRSIESDENIVEQRFGLYQRFWGTSLFGEGLGKYGHAAVFETHTASITDCEYIRMMSELGIVGCIIFGLIYVKAMWKSFFNIKVYFFEFCMLSFYLAAMIGATPLENGSMQNFLFWYCVGRVGRDQILIENKNLKHIDYGGSKVYA